jgi:D-alanyl-lipoteichoic acid acyltransferase DltB (MBOAT superfamily)
VLASYVFYGWWDWRFLILIAMTTLLSYFSGIAISRYESDRKKQKWISISNIVVNLGILGVFKYYNFFAENFAALFAQFGVQLDWVTLDVILPVGISFYTFQALSYSIDVYQKKLPACRDIVAFFAYISFFPQLVAGPIERATNLLPQFYRERTFDYAKAVDGCRQMLWGFFKKVVVADNCATAVNLIWEDYENATGFKLLLGGVLFTFQIYGDFSGYSDIAIGTARLFGFNLMRNFHFPYFSRDIAEFWRRWHISLTTWFRDYIYIPLGGSRCAKWKVMRNTLIIFLVSGFWHGANWTFIVWGAYHAFLFFPLMLFGLNRKYTGEVADGKLLPSLKEAVQMLSTFVLVVIGWIIFRAETITQAWDYLSRMFSPSIFDVSVQWGKKAILYIIILMLVEWFQRGKEHGLQDISSVGILKYRPIRIAFYYLFIVLILLLAGAQGTFIYFQF